VLPHCPEISYSILAVVVVVLLSLLVVLKRTGLGIEKDEVFYNTAMSNVYADLDDTPVTMESLA